MYCGRCGWFTYGAVVCPRCGQPAAPVPSAQPPRRRRVWPWVLAGGSALVAVGLVAVTAVVLLRPSGLKMAERAPVPEDWDPSVTELVEFVEDARDLEFDHPVPVDFLTPEEYRDEVRLDDADLAAGDEEFYEDQAALLRALGLAEGDLDLLDAGNELADSGTLAFYDAAAERIVVRRGDTDGTDDTDDIDVGVEVTLVHELTHALQHQHFPDLFPEDETTGGESFAMTGLVEGDAIRIELEYIDSLDRDEQGEYDDITADQFDEGQEAVADLPASMVAFFDAPYLLGDPFVALLDAMGGDAVDEAFAEPPRSDEQLIDPFRYLDADAPDLPDPPEVEGDVADEGDFGAVGWLVVLAERIDPLLALDAVDGWRGDGYTLYETGGVVCADLVVQGDTETDTHQLHGALVEWAAATPAIAPVVAREGDTVAVTACDPGPDAELDLTGDGARALAYPAARSFLAADEIAFGTDLDGARCLADNLVRRYTLDELEAAEAPRDVDARFTAAADACGVS